MLRFLRLKNLRSCVDTQVVLDHAVSALIGKNGVGKTNILRGFYNIARAAALGDQTIFSFPHSVAGVAAAEMSLQLENVRYRYAIEHVIALQAGQPQSSLSEQLDATIDDGEEFNVFRRSDEGIRSTIGGQRTIAVRRTTSALLALAALLPEADELQRFASPVRRFLEGVDYYLFEDRFDRSPADIVLESEYVRWKERYESDRQPTSSVSFRLLYMHFHRPDDLAEFKSLVGRNGLGLVDFGGVESIETSELSSPATPTGPAPTGDKPPPRQKVFFFPFTPLQEMGGAGRVVNFSDLSAGTRRAIRMVVSLLFDRRSLMLVEEPEVSIHPGLLRKLIDLIRTYSHRTQVLFTSHSADVLDVLLPDEVQLVTAPDGCTTVRRLSEEELDIAREFVKSDGPLSEFFETLE